MALLKTLSALISAYFRIFKEKRFVLYSKMSNPVLLNFQDGKFVPYVKGLFWFKANASIHVLIINWRFILIADNLRPRNSLPVVYVIFPILNRYNIRISDKQHFKDKKKWKFISHKYFQWMKTKNLEIVPLPFVMHHTNYGIVNKIDQTKKRDIKIFFSGNSDFKSYTSKLFSDLFGILNRVEIIDTLKEYSSGINLDISFNIREKSNIRILDWQWSPEKNLKLENRVPNKDWLGYLARADFFLCCPGVNMPFCHHTIEAMSMGCIPILQYNDLFVPRLIHRKNCIVFTNKQDLLETVVMITNMTEDDVLNMRKQVLLYFERHLSTNSISKLFKDPANTEFVFPVNTHSINSYIKDFENTPIVSFNIES